MQWFWYIPVHSSEDFKPDRVKPRKKYGRFIRENNTGLVSLSSRVISFYAVPSYDNYTTFSVQLKEVKTGMIEDGTAIGTQSPTGKPLKDSKSKSKVDLLTDGVNNAGEIDRLPPLNARNSVLEFTPWESEHGRGPLSVPNSFRNRYQICCWK